MSRIRTWIGRTDEERTLAWFVIAGVCCSLVFVLLAGMFPLSDFSGPIGILIDTFTVGLPLVGLALLIAVAILATRLAADGQEPLSPAYSSQAHRSQRVDGKTDRVLDAIAEGKYHDLSSSLDTSVRSELRQGAVTALRTERGIEPAVAREMVRNGEWSDDPVAAEFLAERPTYPITERIRSAMDPGLSYRRRVRRTLDAIDQLTEDRG